MKINALYVMAVGLAVATALFLVWGIGALGILGVEGDPADRMYFGVLAVGVAGSLVARFRPAGMAWAMLAMVFGLAVVCLAALVMGMHLAPYSSVAEIAGLNGMFALLFGGAAWLFWQSGPKQSGRRQSQKAAA